MEFEDLLGKLAKYGKFCRKARATDELDDWVDVGYMDLVLKHHMNRFHQVPSFAERNVDHSGDTRWA